MQRRAPPDLPAEEGGAPGPRSCLRSRLLLGAAAALFPLVALEGACRLLGFGGPPRLYAAERGRSGTGLRRVATVGGGPAAVTTEFPEARPPGHARLVFIGESTATGLPYPPSVAFPARVEAALRRAGLAVDALNASAPGLGIAEIRRRVEEMAGYGPDLLVVYTGSNEFFPWNLLPGRERRSHPLRSRLRELLAGLRLFRLLAPGEPALAGARDYPLEASEEDRREARALCRVEFAALIEGCRRAAVPLLVALPGANLRDAVPKVRRDYPDPEGRISRVQAGVLERAGGGDLPGALALLDETLRDAPDHPVLHFGRGRVLLELGRKGEARLAFERARDLDALPARITADIHAILEEACARASVPRLDAQTVLDAADPTGISGDAVFVDHVHPTAEGHVLLARAILGAMASEPALGARFPADALREAASRVEGARLTPGEEAGARRTEAVFLFPRAYAGGPDSGLAARVLGLLREAAPEDPPDEVAALLLGLLEIRTGDAEVGRRRLRGALERGALPRVEPGLLRAIGETPDSIRARAGG